MHHGRRIATLVAAVGLSVLAIAPASGAASAGDFYTPPANMAKKAPGTIIRSTPNLPAKCGTLT